jgi:hypothetical protein
MQLDRYNFLILRSFDTFLPNLPCAQMSGTKETSHDDDLTATAADRH